MKTIKLILPVILIAGLFLISSCGSTEENTNDTNIESTEETSVVKTSEEITKSFKVFGNCTMCQERIEKAALAVEGVSKASWSTETKMIDLVLDNADLNIEKVQMAIAGVGHDTETHKAQDDVYNNLPDCCQYDRTGKTSNDHDHDHDHEGHKH